MFDNATEKTLRLIAAGVHLKKMHGLEFALLVLIDAGLREGVARAALQDERVCLGTALELKYFQSDDIHPE
ncbi:hypothetical protein LSO07_04570 [Janthinobacterium sp. PLB04]|jgi:hypothetical protein|uniref:Uncharacterized protein n=1 Tax=Janthinobacterium lividum TaxID=29581 RepID=A0AAJ4T660_9BURK|nr:MULTISPECIES: hypothetical protein [Janthinobacterium]KAB0331037.1 hypothetical protein F3B38_04640 [Janthinobacterium lividum]QOU72196.1 hypothetical protein JAB4_016200 [Janthinobacterium sp. HH102]QSX97233.1 hypothetical protein J3P46_04570 [Janthinobacterium lividum]UGQ37157.1 hypothetical protein LSO07_04570 [Janthinobacterium sp. PLB04]